MVDELEKKSTVWPAASKTPEVEEGSVQIQIQNRNENLASLVRAKPRSGTASRPAYDMAKTLVIEGGTNSCE